MKFIKSILNPWLVTLLIIGIIICSLAHLYYGPCQTSKWHYILQKYYCPEWIETDLEFKKEAHKRWRIWFKNGQLKKSIEFKKCSVGYSYVSTNTFEKYDIIINDNKVLELLVLFFKEDLFNPNFKDVVHSNSVDQKEYTRNWKLMTCLNKVFGGSFFFNVSSKETFNELIFNIKLSDVKLHPFRHYSRGELEEIKRNSKKALEIKIMRYFENEKAFSTSKGFSFNFKYMYISGPWTQYKENGEIDFIQTHNNKGEVIRIETYKNGNVDKFFTAK
ncbi:MAG: hypothetical protein COA79_08495 [Planctomycetota bacterium]|nr:MAG: hypothetical protein COA79_08495 [Planctomycetota bacterium]